MKKPVSARLVQRNVFHAAGSGRDARPAAAEPVDTQIFLEGPHPDEVGQAMARLGEQTCFLHAAMRGTHRTVCGGELNGVPLSLDRASR
jgi:hypothetical protein